MRADLSCDTDVSGTLIRHELVVTQAVKRRLNHHQTAIKPVRCTPPDRFFAMSGKPRELEVLDFINGKLSVTSQPVMLTEIKSHCLADNRLPILSFYYRTNLLMNAYFRTVQSRQSQDTSVPLL
jgi:hypothetical protein